MTKEGGLVWMAKNHLLIKYLYAYGEYDKGSCSAAFPTGSINILPPRAIAAEISKRQAGIFKKDAAGNRPVNNKVLLYKGNPYFNVLFFL